MGRVLPSPGGGRPFSSRDTLSSRAATLAEMSRVDAAVRDVRAALRTVGTALRMDRACTRLISWSMG